MSVAIVRYNAGNIQSVAFALERCGVSYCISDDRDVLLSAERVIFPGVGQAASAMKHLREHGLDDVVRRITAPFLGICLGMQLLCRHSEEGSGGTDGLGIIGADVRRFTRPRKVPHMGWSSVECSDHPLFEGLGKREFLYFVHSYRAEVSSECIAEGCYEEPFAAAVAKGNFAGVQFHPERSGAIGERILRNFLRWKS
jgi:glutamine amidotransferase